jgi:hypothetical protein
MTMPSAAGSGNYTQNILSIHDELVKPQFRMQAYEEHGGQFTTFLNLMEMFGSYFPVKDTSYSAFFTGWVTFYLTNKTTVADPGAGNTLTFTLSVDDHTNNGTRSYVRQGDNMIIPGTGAVPKTARVMSVDKTTNYAHIITLMPNSKADNIGSIAAGTRLAFGNDTKPYESNQGLGVNTTEIKRTYHLAIQEENWGAGGHLLTQPTWVPVRVNGEEHVGVVSKELANMEFRLDKKRGMAWWLGSEVTNPDMITNTNEQSYRGDQEAGKQIPGTKGVIRWINELGKTMSITPGSMVWADQRDIKDYWVSQQTGSKVALVVGGHTRIQEWVDLVAEKNQGNATDYASKKVKEMMAQRKSLGFLPREGWDAYFDFKSYTDSGVTYIFVELNEFSDPRSLGLSEYGWNNYAVVFPFGTITTSNTSNAKKDRLLPTMGMAYLSNMGYSRKYEMFYSGSANMPRGRNTNTNDSKNWHKRCHEGGFVANGNQGIIITD